MQWLVLIPSYSLTNIEIQKDYQNKPKFNGVYSRDNLPDKTKDEAYVIDLQKNSDTETLWLFVCIK